MSRIYVFDHIFKTGGTTFNLSYSPAAFEPDEVLVLRGSQGANVEDLQAALALSTEQRARLKLIAGHNAGKLRGCFPDARFVTLVRDPVARAISSYLHAKYHEDARELAGRRIQEQRISLTQYVTDWFEAQHDFQSRVLLGSESRQNPPKSDAEMIAAIGSRFHLVGYTEALELFLFYLHLTEGFPLVLFNNRLVRQERVAFEATAEDLTVMEHYNQMDSRVYRVARLEFDRKVAEVWTSETERFYRKYLDALEFYRSETLRNPHATPLRWTPAPELAGAVGQG
jgi:hypothetical protein